MKKLLTVFALTAGALSATVLPAAADNAIVAAQCRLGGGKVVELVQSPTGLICQGGQFNGEFVLSN
ncbi:hypothetical protein OG892_01725 [Streptomyces sp. NBC_00341]|uniref:hypothetical protein n=1 Tax=unclassified Streptomyces TaxID=2593676 RepID=UPI003087D978|nr:hypothetical protein OG892_01725 [Streptomyces sp. NBC_00341]